jgi:hypothetical protein
LLHVASALDRISRFPCPWEEFVEAVDRVPVDYALENVGDVCVRIDTVEPLRKWSGGLF